MPDVRLVAKRMAYPIVQGTTYAVRGEPTARPNNPGGCRLMPCYHLIDDDQLPDWKVSFVDPTLIAKVNENEPGWVHEAEGGWRSHEGVLHVLEVTWAEAQNETQDAQMVPLDQALGNHPGYSWSGSGLHALAGGEVEAKA